MAAGENQKLKLLYLEKILREETGLQKGLTLKEIILRLKQYGVNADRKTLYADFDELRNFGMIRKTRCLSARNRKYIQNQSKRVCCW